MLARILAAALLVAPAPVTPQDDEPGVAYSAIVLLLCGDASGTAFWIGPDRLITAEHVVAAGRPCTVNGQPVEIVRSDIAKDIAELRGPINPSAMPINCRGFRTNRHYRAIGYVRGYRLTLPQIATRGRSYSAQANGLVVMVGDVIPGMSGGPVIDESGRVVGIVNRHSPSRSRSLSDSFVCGEG